LKQNLLPDDPWTDPSDIEHVMPARTSPAPPELHLLGNLTFLPPEVNRSLADIDWNRKRQAYRWLASAEKMEPCPATFADGTEVPPGVRSYLSDPASKALSHLAAIAEVEQWGEVDMEQRKLKMLAKVWDRLYEGWLG
jgi:hypothetical protein